MSGAAEPRRSTDSWRRFVSLWVKGSSRLAPWIAITALLGTIAAVQYTAQNLSVSTNREKMLSDELPFRQTLARYRALFPQFVDTLVVVVDASTPEDAHAGARALAANLEAQPELFHDIYLPRANEFLEQHALLYLSRAELEDLADRLARVQPFLGRLSGDESLRGLLLLLRDALESESADVDLTPVLTRIESGVRDALDGHPRRLSWQELMRDEVATPDDRRQFVRVRPRLDYQRALPAASAIEAVREAARQLPTREGAAVRARIIGGLAMSHEELSTLRRGAEWIAFGALGLVVVLLLWGLGSPRLAVASVATLLVGLAATAAFATAAIGHLNMVSVAFGVLYIGLGIDYAIHLSLRYREERLRGSETPEALASAAQDVGSSLVLCSFSTALGFYAFVPTSFAGVSELGIISGTGMFISLFLNLTLLPALITLMPIPAKPARARELSPVLGRIADWPIRRHREILWAAAGAAGLGLLSLPWVRFDPNTLNLREAKTESIETFRELLRTSEMPPWSLTLLAQGRDEALRQARELETLPGVSRVLTLDSFIAKHQPEKLQVLEDTALVLGLDAAQSGQASTRSAVEAIRSLRATAKAWLLAPRGSTNPNAVRGLTAVLADLESAATGPNSASVIASLDEALTGTLAWNMRRLRISLGSPGFERPDLPPDLVERWITEDDIWRVEAFALENLEDPAALERFVASVRSVSPSATGSPVIMLESARAVSVAFQQALFVAVVAVAALLAFLLRSLRQVAFVLAPLVLAALATCAAMVAGNIQFNFANVIALPLLLGVGVDNGIHMVDRARQSRDSDANPLRTSTGRAVIFSTLTTSGSFGQLALSAHPGTAGMGLLLSLGMGMTLLATLLLIPALLTWDRSRRASATLTPDVGRSSPGRAEGGVS